MVPQLSTKKESQPYFGGLEMSKRLIYVQFMIKS